MLRAISPRVSVIMKVPVASLMREAELNLNQRGAVSTGLKISDRPEAKGPFFDRDGMPRADEPVYRMRSIQAADPIGSS